MTAPASPVRPYLQHLLSAAVLLGAWEVLARRFDNPLLLPPVSAIGQALIDLVVTGQLPAALGESLQLLVLGLAAATIIGFVFGIIIARSRTAYWMLNPYFAALFVTPTVALVPLVLVWFGFGLTGRVLVVVLAALVPVLFSVASGIRDAPGDLVDVARSFGVKGELALLRRVRLRAAIPVIMAGMRLAVGRAVVGMAIAESYLRLGGIGGLIREYGATFQTAYVFAAILPLTLLGIGLAAVVGRIERHFQWSRQ